MVKDRANSCGAWGLKDPRLCFTAYFYPSPVKVIFVRRNTEDIVASLMKREREKNRLIRPYAFWVTVTTRYTLSAWNYVWTQAPGIVIDYDNLTSVEKQREEIAKLEAFVGREVDTSIIKTRKDS
jgi:hypothetical protein